MVVVVLVLVSALLRAEQPLMAVVLGDKGPQQRAQQLQRTLVVVAAAVLALQPEPVDLVLLLLDIQSALLLKLRSRRSLRVL